MPKNTINQLHCHLLILIDKKYWIYKIDALKSLSPVVAALGKEWILWWGDHPAAPESSFGARTVPSEWIKKLFFFYMHYKLRPSLYLYKYLQANILVLVHCIHFSRPPFDHRVYFVFFSFLMIETSDFMIEICFTKKRIMFLLSMGHMVFITYPPFIWYCFCYL